jgi:hypothetical protein
MPRKKKGEETIPAPSSSPPPKFTAVRDSRDRVDHGWTFEESDVCSGTVVRALKTGDYSVEGLEEVLTVERKGSTSELATNLGEARFERELERMKAFRWAFVICEFSLEDLLAFPSRTSIPASRRRRMRVRGPYLLRRVCELIVRTGIPFFFVGGSGRAFALSLLKRAWELANEEKSE